MIILRKHKYPIESWGNRICGNPVFILGNGPSLIENDLSILDGFFTIGTNRIYKVFDPIVLLWQDKKLLEDGYDEITKSASIKICRKECNTSGEFTGFTLKGPEYSLPTDPSVLHGFGCSGALAVELGVSMGASSVVLLGMDCDYSKDGTTDFYGVNRDHNKFTVGNFHSAMLWVKDNCPVPIYNCGNAPYWEKQNLNEVIGKIKPKRYTRLQWIFNLRKDRS